MERYSINREQMNDLKLRELRMFAGNSCHKGHSKLKKEI